MSVSESQIDATEKYNKKKYDQRLIRFPKGTVERLKTLAASNDLSFNSYVCQSVEFMEMMTREYGSFIRAKEEVTKLVEKDVAEGGDYFIIS